MGPRDSVMRRAGAVIDGRTGVAAHYGSPAGELAVCTRAVGLADRSNLRKLEIGGGTLPDDFVVSLAGRPLAAGEARIGAAGGLYARSADRLVVLLDNGSAAPATLGHPPGSLTVSDRSEDWTVIGLAGPATSRVLSDLGHLSEFAIAGSFAEVRIGSERVQLALPSERIALVIAQAPAAADVWQAIEAAGKPAGISYAGGEAFRRYALWERIAHDRAAGQGAVAASAAGA